MAAVARQEYTTALDAALDELQQLTKELRSLRTRSRNLEKRIAELNTLVHHLQNVVCPSGAGTRPKRPTDRDNVIILSSTTAKPAFREVVKSFVKQPDKEWRVKELENSLRKSGTEVDYKYLHNAINYLTERGALVKMGRGVYRANEYGFVVIDGEEMDYGE